MSITAADEETRTGGDGFADAVTVSFGDPGQGWYGMARLGVAGEAGSALAILFHGKEPVGALAQGGIAPGDGPLSMTVDAPLERWTVRWNGAEAGFELTLEAISAPASWERLGGMDGYEQLVAVSGTVRAGEGTAALSGTGQRGHSWGVADWSSLDSVRTLGAWLGDGGIVLSATRPTPKRNDGHDREDVWASVVLQGEPVDVFDPRLSTTYDGDGHQRRAGLELWMDEEEGYPVRAAGEVLCGSTLDLGQLTLDLAFMKWRSEGVEGVGRYDVLRRKRD